MERGERARNRLRGGLAGLVDQARQMFAVLRNGTGEGGALLLDRLDRVLGRAFDLLAKLMALFGNCREQDAALVRKDRFQFERALAHNDADTVGVADEAL